MSARGNGENGALGIASSCMGLLPAAAAASSIAAAAWTALSLLIFSSTMRLLGPFFRKAAGERAAAFLLIFILASLSSVVVSVVGFVDPAPALALGIYLPLTVASGPWTREAHALSRGDLARPHSSSIAAALIVLLCGLVREAVGASRIGLPLGLVVAKVNLPGSLSMGPMENPVGTLFTLSFVAAIAQWSSKWKKKETA